MGIHISPIQFSLDVEAVLYCPALVAGVHRGDTQSLSWLKSHMREKGWVTGRLFEGNLKANGFDVVRGRMKNAWKNGYGQECDVVILARK